MNYCISDYQLGKLNGLLSNRDLEDGILEELNNILKDIFLSPLDKNLTFEEYNVKNPTIDEDTAEQLAEAYFLGIEDIELERCSVNSNIMKKYNIKYEIGIPDFCYEKDNKINFLEIKSEKDELRLSQFKWILDNSDKHIRVVKLIQEKCDENERLDSERLNWIKKTLANLDKRTIPWLQELINKNPQNEDAKKILSIIQARQGESIEPKS